MSDRARQLRAAADALQRSRDSLRLAASILKSTGDPGDAEHAADLQANATTLMIDVQDLWKQRDQLRDTPREATHA